MSSESVSMARQLVPLAKVIAMTSAGAAVGANWAFSYAVIPAVLDNPHETLAKSWETAFHIGKATMPALAVFSSGLFAFLASQSSNTPGRFGSPFALYTGAAMALPLIIPYTGAVMMPTNHKLMKKAREPGSMSEEETRNLIVKWKDMNYVRTVMCIAGAVMGAMGVVGS